MSITEILQFLVAIDTRNPPGNEMSLVRKVERILKDYPVIVQVLDLGANRANLVAIVEASNPERDPIVLNGHMDTVQIFGTWATDPLELTEGEEGLYGLGAADMKGALACQLAVLLDYSTHPDDLRQDLWLVWTAGEEVDCLGAQAMIPKLRQTSLSGIIIGEPSMNQVTTAQKGALWLQLSVTGAAAHGAYPENGINAIQPCATVVAHIIDALEGKEDHPLLGPVSVNWSSITGGSQPNVVPDAAQAVLDIRFPPPVSKREILECVESIITTVLPNPEEATSHLSISYSVLNHRAAFETDWEIPLVKKALSLTGQHHPVGMRAYTDGSVFAHEVECPLFIIGPGDIAQAHAPNEHISQEQLVLATEIYSQLVGR